jgi:hypothetical protein
MADLLAMNRGYVSEIESGKKDPSLTMQDADGLSVFFPSSLKGYKPRIGARYPGIWGI